MSKYSRLVEEFFTRYEKPQVDKLTIGFSGIDPPLKVLASEIDHEELNNLLGGDETGHYHLTKDQWEKVLKLLDDEPEPTPPEDWDDYDGGFASTSESEYNENSDHWLDGGFSPNDHEEIYDGGEAA